MATKVGELFVELAVDAASGNLSVRQLVGALGDLDVASVTTVGILAKIGETLWGMAKAATDTAVELTALHDLTGVNPQMVQQWEKAAVSVGVHSGTIIKAITAVNQMNRRLATGQGAPPELTGILGLSAYKIDKNGKEVLKDATDLMKEMAAPGSTYRTRSPLIQQQGLGVLFGGAGDEAFRFINQMIAGKVHPETFSGLDTKQIKQLEEVRSKESEFSAHLADIFDRLITSGGTFASTLDDLNEVLKSINGFLGSVQGKEAIQGVGNVISSFIHPFRTAGRLLGEQGGKSTEDAFMREINNRAKLAGMAQEKSGELRARVDVNLKHNDQSLGAKTVYLDRKVTNAEVLDATLALGNTP